MIPVDAPSISDLRVASGRYPATRRCCSQLNRPRSSTTLSPKKSPWSSETQARVRSNGSTRMCFLYRIEASIAGMAPEDTNDGQQTAPSKQLPEQTTLETLNEPR